MLRGVHILKRLMQANTWLLVAFFKNFIILFISFETRKHLNLSNYILIYLKLISVLIKVNAHRLNAYSPCDDFQMLMTFNFFQTYLSFINTIYYINIFEMLF